MKIRALFLVLLLLFGCNRPLTKDEEDATKALAVVLGIFGAVYLLSESSSSNKESLASAFSGGGGGGSSKETETICTRGSYQGRCSYHGGIDRCVNYDLICKDGSKSRSRRCIEQDCVFQ